LRKWFKNWIPWYFLYPNLITPKWSLGTTHEGRQIWAVKISDNPNVNENEPQVFFDALIHAREPQSMATVLYFMYYLLENYGINQEVTYLVNNREIYFVPVLNPDGYVYNQTTNPSGGGDWRKNRRNNSGSYGVDLNRNLDISGGLTIQAAAVHHPLRHTGVHPHSRARSILLQRFCSEQEYQNTQ
jgi:murein tripeptide amidase MpaA